MSKIKHIFKRKINYTVSIIIVKNMFSMSIINERM